MMNILECQIFSQFKQFRTNNVFFIHMCLYVLVLCHVYVGLGFHLLPLFVLSSHSKPFSLLSYSELLFLQILHRKNKSRPNLRKEDAYNRPMDFHSLQEMYPSEQTLKIIKIYLHLTFIIKDFCGE